MARIIGKVITATKIYFDSSYFNPSLSSGGSIPTVATGSEVDTGTDNAKMVTPKAMEDSSYVKLGETSSTAYRGDRGKTAYDHSQAAHAPSDADNTVATILNVINDYSGELPETSLFVGVDNEQNVVKFPLSALKRYFDTIYQSL